jgi:hypothetical protein
MKTAKKKDKILSKPHRRRNVVDVESIEIAKMNKIWN